MPRLCSHYYTSYFSIPNKIIKFQVYYKIWPNGQQPWHMLRFLCLMFLWGFESEPISHIQVSHCFHLIWTFITCWWFSRSTYKQPAPKRPLDGYKSRPTRRYQSQNDQFHVHRLVCETSRRCNRSLEIYLTDTDSNLFLTGSETRSGLKRQKWQKYTLHIQQGSVITAWLLYPVHEDLGFIHSSSRCPSCNRLDRVELFGLELSLNPPEFFRNTSSIMTVPTGPELLSGA